MAKERFLNERKMFLNQRPDPIKDGRGVPDLHMITRAMNTQHFYFAFTVCKVT